MPVDGELLRDGGSGGGVLEGLGSDLEGGDLERENRIRTGQVEPRKQTYLALVERSGLDLSLLLKAVNNIAVRPSDLVRQTLEEPKQRSATRFRVRVLAFAASSPNTTRNSQMDRNLTLMVQNLRPGLRRRTRRAWGTTIFFLRSYGGGMPSKSFKRSRAAAPRAV